MRNKFGAIKTTVDGITFASKAEAKRYGELRLLWTAGTIKNLELQPKFDLIVVGHKVGTYTADFAYTEGSHKVVEEVKGFKARDFAIRSKLFMALNPDRELRINGEPAKKPKTKWLARKVHLRSLPDGKGHAG